MTTIVAFQDVTLAARQAAPWVGVAQVAVTFTIGLGQIGTSGTASAP